MKPPKKSIEKWIQALRSGKYKQNRIGNLYDNGSFCCLGVACDVVAPNYDREDGKIRNTVMPGVYYGAPAWLAGIDDDFDDKTDKSLVELNDSGGYSFDEIADLIQLVYLEGMLK